MKTHETPLVLSFLILALGQSCFCATVRAEIVTTVSYSGPGVSIPDNSSIGKTVYLEVDGLGIITDLDFRLDALPGCDGNAISPGAAISHTFVGDLVLTLTAPDGAPSVAIVSRPGPAPNGSPANNFCAVLLDDDGGYPSIGSIVLSNNAFVQGNFAPQSPLSAFDGENPNGYWKLKISGQPRRRHRHVEPVFVGPAYRASGSDHCRRDRRPSAQRLYPRELLAARGD